MDKRVIAPSLALVLAAAIAGAVAPADESSKDAPPAAVAAADAENAMDAGTSDPDTDALMAAYQQNERKLYDTLVADASPRVQVLAESVYISSDDATPTALRPKREDVVDRAVEFAPDDAFVQTSAAASGSYQSSSCGPTRWPDAAVANLVRLEPDNAGAWRFGVALAFAKGDQAGLDEALSRMAAASRADDHAVEEVAAWTAVFAAHPDLIDMQMSPYRDMGLTAADSARITALNRLSYGGSRAKNSLARACTPDGASADAWRRLGWCADAGRLLADKGSSIELRDDGLAVLAAIGDRSDETIAAQREHDWLEANRRIAVRAFDDRAKVDAALADWDGASSEIAAIRHRLKRLGLPATPPATWTKESDPLTGADAAKAMKQYGEYMSSVFADMRVSSSSEQRLAAALNEYVVKAIVAASNDESPAAVDNKQGGEEIATLAAANAGNIRIQWMVANASAPNIPDEAKATAIASVQQAEGDNAASWEFSLELPSAAAGELTDTLLQRMAASTRFDSHLTYAVTPFLDAMRQRPLPPDLMASYVAQLGENASPDLAAKITALSMAYANMNVPIGAARACAPSKGTPMESSRRDACIAVGRLLVQKAPTIAAMRFGESILRKLDALDAAESDRTRHALWWHSTMLTESVAGHVDAIYVDDYVTSGNEIDALRRSAESRGKAEPPADWKPHSNVQAH